MARQEITFYEHNPTVVDAVNYRDAAVRGQSHNIAGPTVVHLQVNYGCFLQCLPCDRWKWTQNGFDEKNALSTNELQTLFTELGHMGTKRMTVVGTEAVRRRDFDIIIPAIRANGMKPDVYTAGIVLDDERHVNPIIDAQADVSLSLDGFRAATHNDIRFSGWRGRRNFNPFEKTLESISRLRDARSSAGLTSNQMRITANMTLQKANIDDLLTAGPEQVDSLGVDILRLSIVHGAGSFILDRHDMSTIINFYSRVQGVTKLAQVDLSDAVLNVVNRQITPEDFDRNILVESDYIIGVKKTDCRIGDFSTVIAPDGTVYPCLYLYGDNLPLNYQRNKFALGQIREAGSFGAIWNSEAYQRFRDANFPDFSCSSGHFRECAKCEYINGFTNLNNAIEGKQSGNIQIGW